MGTVNTSEKQKEILVLMLASSKKKKISKNNLEQIGTPTRGVNNDVDKFREKFINFNNNFIETNRDEDLLLTRSFIMSWLKKYFGSPVYDIHLFYTGNGHKDGDWLVQTVQKAEGDRISLEQILQLWNCCKISKSHSHLYLYLDSSYSGRWCQRLANLDQKYNKKNVTIIASYEGDQEAKNYGCRGLLYNCIFSNDTNEFEASYEFLVKEQKPIASFGGKKAAPLSKQQLKFIQGKLNAKKLFSSVEQNKQIILYSDGDDRLRYEGKIKDGKCEGRGTLFYKNGDKYEGEFKDGKQNGRVIYYWSNGDIYKGEFKNRKRQGKGTMYYNDGNRYDGDWKNDNKQGKGKFYFNNGDIYQGEFENDNFEGEGILYYEDGSKSVGEWVNDQVEGKATFYAKDD